MISIANRRQFNRFSSKGLDRGRAIGCYGDLNRYERLYRNFDEEGRALANLLTQNNGRYLYADLPYSNWFHIPWNIHDREDFIHDFFLEICKEAHTFNGGFRELKDIKENDKAVIWLNSCFRRYSSDHYRLRRGYPKRIGAKKLPKNFILGLSMESGDGREGKEGGGCELLERISYESYLRDKGRYFPGAGLIAEEEAEEVEYREKRISEMIYDALPKLTKTQREIIDLRYFQGKKTQEIAKELGRSHGSVRTFLYLAKRRLKVFLPRSVVESREWIES